jgi:glycosyltransferase involved in cell wall biosynthesis
MKTSVIIATYMRDWALPYSLSSLREQTKIPDEVTIILKAHPRDKSWAIINSFSKNLNIKLIIQRRGNFTDAISMGIEYSHGDLILFLDDDAIAEKIWVEKYLKLFKMFPQAGGISGITYKAFKIKNNIVTTKEDFYERRNTKIWFHRTPLNIFEGYTEFISDSGIPGRFPSSSFLLIRSALLNGVNMAWRREVLLGNDLAKAFKDSKIGSLNEQYLACYARLKGYHTYRIIDPEVAPIVWHIQHPYSLQRKPIWSDFWRDFDLAYNYWRLKHLGCQTSFPKYVMGLIVLSRRKTSLRILAYLYGFIKGLSFALSNKCLPQATIIAMRKQPKT